ncbi:ATP-binding/permease protein CydD [compost metagenome]
MALPELTLITITHNLNDELLEQYDEIWFMEDGRITESGSLKEMQAQGGSFSRFYQRKAPGLQTADSSLAY